MDYQRFCKELKKGVLQHELWTISESDYILYPDGFTSENPEEIAFIRSTNFKYNHIEADILKGDYIVLNIPTANSYCKFSLSSLFEEYISNGWERVWHIIDESIKAIDNETIHEVTQKIIDHSFAKERLIVRPINYTDNRYELKEAVYKQYGDVALVLYAILYDNKELGLGTFKIPKTTAKGWKVDFEELWTAAIINTNIIAPPRMYLNLKECKNSSYYKGAFMALNNKFSHIAKFQFPIITTSKQTNGAIALFYPGVMERIAELFGDSYYISFISIHHVHIYHKDAISPRTILRNLKDTNKILPRKELLSRKVYYYDKDKQMLEMLEL